MDLNVAFKEIDENGSRVYDVMDMEDPRHVVRAELEIWRGATGGWGFTAHSVPTEDDPSKREELVESGQQDYRHLSYALKYGLADLTAFYHGDVR